MDSDMVCGKKRTSELFVLSLDFRILTILSKSFIPFYVKGEKVDDYIPDLIIENQVVVDTKTIDSIGDVEIGQMLNYLRVTGLQVGLIINFKKSKLEWKRVVLSDH